jgi:hypothetical protein
MEKGRAKAIGRSIDLVSDYLGASHNTVHKTNETSGERWGNNEYTVESVDILDPNGAATDVVHTGKPMTVRIHYKKNADVSDVIAGLRISHLHGTQVFATNSRRRDTPLGGFGEMGYVDLQIPRIPMLAGTFQVSVDLSDPSELYTYDHWGQCVTFDVLQDLNQDEGLVTIDSQWSHTVTK